MNTNMKMISLKMWRNSVLLLLTIQLICIDCFAGQIGVYLGPKFETLETALSKKSRSNLVSFLGEYNFKLYSKFHLSAGITGELEIDGLTSQGFGLYASTRYYFKGHPNLITTEGEFSKLVIVQPQAFFVGFGFFQKSIEFEGIGDEDLGGPFISGGYHYSISERYFLSAIGQYLISGSGTNKDYTSIEIYGGLGMRF